MFAEWDSRTRHVQSCPWEKKIYSQGGRRLLERLDLFPPWCSWQKLVGKFKRLKIICKSEEIHSSRNSRSENCIDDFEYVFCFKWPGFYLNTVCTTTFYLTISLLHNSQGTSKFGSSIFGTANVKSVEKDTGKLYGLKKLVWESFRRRKKRKYYWLW